MVQRPESDVGFLGHVLDLNALVLVVLQEHETRINDALTACTLVFGQYVRRYRFCHLSLSSDATPSFRAVARSLEVESSSQRKTR